MRTSQYKQFTTNSTPTLSLTRKITLLSTIIALSPIVAFLCLTNPLSISPASATTSKSKTVVNIDPVASIAIEAYDPNTGSYIPSTNPSMTINPDYFNTMAARVTTSTNSPTGLTLYINDSDTNNALVEQHDDPSSPVDPVISSITNNVTIDDTTDSTKAFPTNTWGYAFNAITTNNGTNNNTNNNSITTPPTIPLTYSAIPTTETTIAETDTNGDNAYIFTAGSRVDMNLPASIYKDQLTFTVVANAVPDTRTIFDLDFMQEMNTTICSNTPTPVNTAVGDNSIATSLDQITIDPNTKKGNKVPSTTLIDERDNQQYTIRKLADGNCWMTENLRYGTNLDNSARPWNNATDPKLTNTTADGVTKLSDPDDGLIISHIITGNSGQKGADGSSAFNDTDEYYTKPYIAIYDANTIDNVSNTGTKFGTLYNYCAATGGTACTPSGTTPTVSGSICPNNWALPDMDNQVGVEDGTAPSYNNLTVAYGIEVNKEAGANRILAMPLSFPRAGYFYDGGLYLRSGSGYGYYWSSRPSDGSNAYYLDFGSTADINRNYGTRRVGRSVRCVVAGN